MPMLVMACAVTVFVIAVYAYMYHEVGRSIAAGQEAQAAVVSGRADKARAQEFMGAYRSSASDLARLPGFFVPSDDAVAFIEAVEGLGTETGATDTISAIQANDLDGSAPGTEGAVSAHVSVSGSWSEDMRVLELAELLPYQTTVSGTRLDTGSSAGGAKGSSSSGHVWNLSFDIKAATLVPIPATSTPAVQASATAAASSSTSH